MSTEADSKYEQYEQADAEIHLLALVASCRTAVHEWTNHKKAFCMHPL